MSKPIARIALVAVISLILVAATYVTVQGAFAKTTSAGVHAHLVSGLQTNFDHDRSTISELEALQAQNNSYSQPGSGKHQGGGCHDEMHVTPQD